MDTRYVSPKLNRPVLEAKPSAQPNSNHLQNTVPNGRGQTTWITAKIYNFLGTDRPVALPFIFHTSAICSYFHRDIEEAPSNFISGQKVFARLRTACTWWKWNNNTSSRYRGLYLNIRSPFWSNVLPKTGEVWSRPFHSGKYTKSTELHIFHLARVRECASVRTDTWYFHTRILGFGYWEFWSSFFATAPLIW